VIRPLKKAAVFGFLLSARGVRRTLVSSPRAARLLRPGFEGALWRIGKWRVWLLYEDACRTVPAYRTVWQEHGCPRIAVQGLDPDLSVVPITDKASYVKRFSVEERCRNGRLPAHGVVVDESSGTSGEPNNWVRGQAERDDGRKLLHIGMDQVFRDEQLFVVNAFALGPWATGMNVSMSLVDVAILKSTGPDVEKIASTLRQFGTGYRYLICGYPPFLKRLVDSDAIDLQPYRVSAAVGGEGMSESLRDYLLQTFDRVYSSFGASDLEINIAAENDFTIALRRLLRDRPEIGEALGLGVHALPMVFQFNPLDYHIETTEDGELVVSVCRLVRFPQLLETLGRFGVSPQDLSATFLDLPVLFHFGRSDATVAFYGANVGPADVQEALFAVPALAERVSSFALVVGEDDEANKTLCLAFELIEGREASDAGQVRDQILEELARVNWDYREAARFMPAERRPTVEFHAAGTGPFAGYDPRLKRVYISGS
jgi:phenylacetate-coenzyme A ligase PaaK-like adenylate-forming protein